tara:strand:+ start:33 stop:242 length:210 start_codon:yes stop_codon:yes gene_type:complete
MKPNLITKLAWKRMMSVKDCKKYNCKCGDELRKILLKIPISSTDEKLTNIKINLLEKNYRKCYNKKIDI